MRDVRCLALLLFLSGCASVPPSPRSLVDEMLWARFQWPEWNPTPLRLIEQSEDGAILQAIAQANAGSATTPLGALQLNLSAPKVAKVAGPAPTPVPPFQAATPTPPPSLAQAPVAPPQERPSPPESKPSAAPSAVSGDIEYAEVGKPVRLAASANGTPPLFFQWRKDGQPINGETKSVLAIEKATPVHAGIYDCVVRNSAGSGSSQPVKLVVRVP